MTFVEVPSAKIRYELTGSGDPTVLVHGSLVDGRTWSLVQPGLSASLSVLSYDRRGHGESVGAMRTRPVRDDALDLANLLEKLDLYPVHLIGHSYGGVVSLRLAVDRPELVRSVSVHEPPFLGLLEDDPVDSLEGARLREGIERIQGAIRAGQVEAAAREVVDAFSVEDGAWERLRPEVREGLARHLDRWAEEFSDPESTRAEPSELHDLLIPVLVTNGERSPPFVRRITRHLADQLKNATLRSIPDAGHVPHISDPNRFIALTQAFLVERNVPST